MVVELVSSKRVLVVGLGVTGSAVVHVLSQMQGVNAPESIVSLDSKNPNATYSDVSQIEFTAIDLVVASPGWAPTSDVLVAAQDAGVPIWSEIELAWQLRVSRPDGSFAPWVGVTGTNGKTTTIGMVESILKADGRNAVAVGNVGRPVIEVALDPEVDVVALELSSFQLHYTHSIALTAAAVLNIAPDHIDWHGSYENYCADKGRIFENVVTACIYNISDEQTRNLVVQADVADGARAVGFTLGSPGRSDVGLVEDVLVDRAFHMDVTNPFRHQNAAELATLDDLRHLASGKNLPPHIVANALAAAALTRAVGVSQAAVRDGLRGYLPGGHRIAQVASAATPDGGIVLFVDDSKATNAHAAQASLEAFEDGRVVWIAGGLAKGARFEQLVEAIKAKLKSVVLIGVDQSAIAEALAAVAPEIAIYRVSPTDETGVQLAGEAVMAQAVALAGAEAADGDVVLLAPASASMDQFSSYAERGDAFAYAAREYARTITKD